LQWIYNINQVSINLIANRVGELPEMLMFHNNHLRTNFTFSFEPSLHTRIDTQLVYEKSFIAVADGSQLIDEWIE
jgi:hypothetical protein